jgi:hypothetical protein
MSSSDGVRWSANDGIEGAFEVRQSWYNSSLISEELNNA